MVKQMATINLSGAIRYLTERVAGVANAPIDFIKDPGNLLMITAYLASVFFGPYLPYSLPSIQTAYPVAQAGLALLIIPPVRSLTMAAVTSVARTTWQGITFTSKAASAGVMAAVAYGVYVYSQGLDSGTAVNMMTAAVNSVKNVPSDVTVAIGESLTKAANGLGWVNPKADLEPVLSYLSGVGYYMPGGSLPVPEKTNRALAETISNAAANYVLFLPRYAMSFFRKPEEDTASENLTEFMGSEMFNYVNKKTKEGLGFLAAAPDALYSFSEAVWVIFSNMATKSYYQQLREKIIKIEAEMGLSTKSWVPGFSAEEGVNDLYYEYSGRKLSEFNPEDLKALLTKGRVASPTQLDKLNDLYFAASKEVQGGASRLTRLRENFLKNAGVSSPESLSKLQFAEYSKLPTLAEKQPTLLESVFEFLQSLRDMATSWFERFLFPIREALESILGAFWAKIALIFGLCICAVAAYFLFRKIYNLMYGKSKSVGDASKEAYTILENVVDVTSTYVSAMYKVILDSPNNIVESNQKLTAKVIDYILRAPSGMEDEFSQNTLRRFKALQVQTSPSAITVDYLKLISEFSEETNERIESLTLLGDDSVLDKLSNIRSTLIVMYTCFSIVRKHFAG